MASDPIPAQHPESDEELFNPHWEYRLVIRYFDKPDQVDVMPLEPKLTAGEARAANERLSAKDSPPLFIRWEDIPMRAESAYRQFRRRLTTLFRSQQPT